MSRQENGEMRKVRVEGIHSANTLIVSSKDGTEIHALQLSHVCALSLGEPGKADDQLHPHAMASWLWVRDRLSKKMVDEFDLFQPGERFLTNSTYGRIPFFFARVIYKDQAGVTREFTEDAVKEGIVKVADDASGHVAGLLKGHEATAKRDKRGLWGAVGTGKYIKTVIKQEDWLRKDMEGYVWRVGGDGSLDMLVMTGNDYVVLRLCIAGIGAVQYNGTRNHLAGLALHRKIKFRIMVGKRSINQDKYGVRSFVGQFLPDDKMVMELLNKGFFQFSAKTAQWAPNANEYVKLEVEATKLKKREFKAELGDSLKGVCTAVKRSNEISLHCADGAMVVCLSCLKVPYWLNEHSSVICERFGFEAREYLRKTLLGKSVTTKATGSLRDHRYAGVYCGDVYVNKELLKQGLAELCEPFVGERAPDWNLLQRAQEEAKKARVGIWSNSKAVCETRDFTGPGTHTDSLMKLKGTTRHKGIIEGVRYGFGREGQNRGQGMDSFIVYLPVSRSWVNMRLRGVIVEQNDNFKSYATDTYVGCDVSIIVNEVYRNILAGTMRVTLRDGRQADIDSDLIDHGLAKLREGPDGWQSSATGRKRARARVTNFPVRSLQVGAVETVKVVSLWNSVKYGLQFISDEMKRIEELLQALDASGDDANVRKVGTVNIGDCVIFQRMRGGRNRFVRAVVKDEVDSFSVNLALLDYSMSLYHIHKDRLYEAPDELKKIPAQGITVKLGCCCATTDENIDDIWSICKDNRMYAHLMYEDAGEPAVLLTDQPDQGSGSLNRHLLTQGIVQYKHHDVHQDLVSIAAQLTEQQ